jgi:hypothetical protein
MSVALHGNLNDFGIADVFQLIGQQRKTGVLELSRRRETVRILFDRGAVVSAEPAGARPEAGLGEMLVSTGLLTRDRVEALEAESDATAETFAGLAVRRGGLAEEKIQEIRELLTRETLFSILRWSNGSFDFKPRRVEHDREFDSILGAEQILMDGMRMVDEWQHLTEVIPSEDHVYRQVPGSEDRSPAGVDSDACERVLPLVDGRLTVRRIIDLSRLGSFEAVRILAQLRDCGLIEPVASEIPSPRCQRPIPARSATLRRIASTLIPLLVLAFAAGLAASGGEGAEGREYFALRDSALERVRRAYGTRRVRHAIEAYRLREGRWPARLGEVASLHLLPDGALASAAGAPYYYARREGGALLLAPER